MYVYTHFQSGSFIRTKSSGSSRGGQPASLLQTESSYQTTWQKMWHRTMRSPCSHLAPDEIYLLLHIRNESSLCSAEGQLEVVPGLVGVEDGVLEGVREEAVHQGAEGYAVFPAWGEVLDVHPLFRGRGEAVREKKRQRMSDKGAELCTYIAPRGNNSKRAGACLPHMALFWPCTSLEASVWHF